MPYPQNGDLVVSNLLLGRASSVADLKTFTGLLSGAISEVVGMGFYRYDSSYAGPFDNTTAVAPNSGGGGWVLEAPHFDLIESFQGPRQDDLEELFTTIEQLRQQVQTLQTDLSNLVTKFNTHGHTGVTTGGGTSGGQNQGAASVTATPVTTIIYYTSEA